MWSDRLLRASQTIGEDIVRNLSRRSPYRIVETEQVLQNLHRRLENDSRLEQLYRENKPATPEIIRQAHFAFFEQVHTLLQNGPQQQQAFEELARYFYRRAIVCIYDLVPQHIGSAQEIAQLEFKQLALESTQAATADIYARIAWTGGVADPSDFYAYANRTIWRQCRVTLSQWAASHSASAPRENVTQVTQPKGCSVILMDSIRTLVDQSQRDVATLFLAGIDHNGIAKLLGRPESEVAAGISRLLQDWSNDVSLQERLRSYSDDVGLRT